MCEHIFKGLVTIPVLMGGYAKLVPLHWSMSMIRAANAYLVWEPRIGAVEKLTEELLGGHLAHATVPKRAARMSLFFSDTSFQLEGGKIFWKQIDDIERGKYCYTDGAGQIDAELLRAKLQLPNNMITSAIQVRLSGCKGVLQVCPGLKQRTGYDALLCKSMVKVPVDTQTIQLNRDYNKIAALNNLKQSPGEGSENSPNNPTNPTNVGGGEGKEKGNMVKIEGKSEIFICEYARRLPLFLNHQVNV